MDKNDDGTETEDGYKKRPNGIKLKIWRIIYNRG